MAEDVPAHDLRVEVLEKFAALITAAFALVAALAWNDAIRALFAEVFGTDSALAAQVAYAFAVTVIAVVAAFGIARSSARAKQRVAPSRQPPADGTREPPGGRDAPR